MIRILHATPWNSYHRDFAVVTENGLGKTQALNMVVHYNAPAHRTTSVMMRRHGEWAHQDRVHQESTGEPVPSSSTLLTIHYFVSQCPPSPANRDALDQCSRTRFQKCIWGGLRCWHFTGKAQLPHFIFTEDTSFSVYTVHYLMVLF